MWTEQSSTIMVFDHDADWPAPGWLLSFGKIFEVGIYQGGVLQEPDGTLHTFTGNTFGGWGNIFIDLCRPHHRWVAD
jgi:hypothetical protein